MGCECCHFRRGIRGGIAVKYMKWRKREARVSPRKQVMATLSAPSFTGVRSTVSPRLSQFSHLSPEISVRIPSSKFPCLPPRPSYPRSPSTDVLNCSMPLCAGGVPYSSLFHLSLLTITRHLRQRRPKKVSAAPISALPIRQTGWTGTWPVISLPALWQIRYSTVDILSEYYDRYSTQYNILYTILPLSDAWLLPTACAVRSIQLANRYENCVPTITALAELCSCHG